MVHRAVAQEFGASPIRTPPKEQLYGGGEAFTWAHLPPCSLPPRCEPTPAGTPVSHPLSPGSPIPSGMYDLGRVSSACRLLACGPVALQPRGPAPYPAVPGVPVSAGGAGQTLTLGGGTFGSRAGHKGERAKELIGRSPKSPPLLPPIAPRSRAVAPTCGGGVRTGASPHIRPFSGC